MTDADVIPRLLHAVDVLDWEVVRGALASEVLVDYTSLAGGEPQALAAGDLLARWQALLPGFDATQHVTGPVLLSDDGGPGVQADTHLVAYHRMPGTAGGETWVLHGHYTVRLVAGKITELTLTVFFQDGNLDLPRLAMERAATGQGRRSRG